MLERKPSLTDQAKAYIKQRIRDDDFAGDRIPSETDLASELGVSRTTIRDALSRLENEGVVYRKQGAGTFVNKAGLQIKTRLEEIWSYEAVLEAHGYIPSTRILDIAEVAAGVDGADLGLAPDAPVVRVQKLFLEDDEPVIFTVNRIPTHLITESYEAQDWEAPVFEVLWSHGRQRLSYYLSEIVPVVASPDLAQTLQVAPGTPLISFAEIGYNDENEPILRADSYLRDDLLRLRLIRRWV
jgi:GntR family transcriptional regulator